MDPTFFGLDCQMQIPGGGLAISAEQLWLY